MRLEVVEALITIQGDEKSATVPSGKLRLVAGFEIEAGETTILTLDFDAGRSVVLRGRMDLLLRPAVKLLVRKADRPLSDADEVSSIEPEETPTPRPTATPRPQPTARPTATPVPPTPTPAAPTVVLTPSKDNTLYESANGSLSNGTGEHFFAGNNNGGSTRRGLIAFDLSAIPASATVNSVTLTLNMSRTTADSVNVSLHGVLADWGEAGSRAQGEQGGGGAAMTGDATWLHRFSDTQTWDNPDGDFASAASATIQVGGLGPYTWGSTSEMVADVQAWVDNALSNFGWMVRGAEGAGVTRSAKRFDTREVGAPDNRPVVVVEYTPAS